MEIHKRTDEHLHASDEQAVSCSEVKVGMKMKARDSQDSSYHIVGESLETVTEGTDVKLPKLDSLKRTIQRQQAAPVQPTTLEQLTLPEEYKRTSKGEQFLLYYSVLCHRGSSSSERNGTWRCCSCPLSGLLMVLSRRLLHFYSQDQKLAIRIR